MGYTLIEKIIKKISARTMWSRDRLSPSTWTVS